MKQKIKSYLLHLFLPRNGDIFLTPIIPSPHTIAIRRKKNYTTRIGNKKKLVGEPNHIIHTFLEELQKIRIGRKADCWRKTKTTSCACLQHCLVEYRRRKNVKCELMLLHLHVSLFTIKLMQIHTILFCILW